MARDLLTDPPAPPRMPPMPVGVEPPRPIGPGAFAYLYRLGAGVVAFATAFVALMLIGWATGWTLSPAVIVAEGVVICLVVVVAEFLLKGAYGEYETRTDARARALIAEQLIAEVDDRYVRAGGNSTAAVADAGRADARRKRTLDVLLAGWALFIVAPAMLLIALLVKLDSPGPAFWFKRRVGEGGKPFMQYYFRTMYCTENGASMGRLTREDERITRVGHFLRRYDLDMLPTLFNVLRGEMTIVGPYRFSASELGSDPLRPAIFDVVVPIENHGDIDVFTLDFVKMYQRAWSVTLDLRIVGNVIFDSLRPKHDASV